MRIIGFNFVKINAERLKDNPGNIKFNTKIDISSIDSLKQDLLKTKEEIVKINFTYSILYEPEFAKIEFAGNILLAIEPKIAKELLKDWKNQEISEDVKLFIFNVILKKSNIKSLQLEDELGLPIHIPLPSLNKGAIKEKKE